MDENGLFDKIGGIRKAVSIHSTIILSDNKSIELTTKRQDLVNNIIRCYVSFTNDSKTKNYLNEFVSEKQKSGSEQLCQYINDIIGYCEIIFEKPIYSVQIFQLIENIIILDEQLIIMISQQDATFNRLINSKEEIRIAIIEQHFRKFYKAVKKVRIIIYEKENI